MSAPLTFVAAPLGLEPLVDFDLRDVEGADGLYALIADLDMDVRLFVIDAAMHLPQYQPTISDDQRDSLGLESPDDASVLVVINPSGDETTVNLLAPIVVNTQTGRCQQFILDADWPVRAPLSGAAA